MSLDLVSPPREGVQENGAQSRTEHIDIASNSTSLSSLTEDTEAQRSGREEDLEEGRSVEHHPNGYPRVAAFVDSDENFLIYRRFGLLRNRVLLHAQDELADLERKLNQMDKTDERQEPAILKSRQRDENQALSRRALLLEKIDRKLKEYDDLMIRSEKTYAMKRPSKRNVNSYYHTINNFGALMYADSEFVHHTQDLIHLAPSQEDSWLNGVVEDFFIRLSKPLSQMLFGTAETRGKSSDTYLYYYSKRKLDNLVGLVITLLLIVLLMVPIFLQTSIKESPVMRNVIVLAFTIAFAIVLFVFTHAKRHELFAITAAYCAVLVVFLGTDQSKMAQQG
ncbi:MAG: hypothetical protein M1837_004184 [Sclerophora amabilis]|nr:MAG: hypothetical protein M1837_004184 [Sclerophora amabilis]